MRPFIVAIATTLAVVSGTAFSQDTSEVAPRTFPVVDTDEAEFVDLSPGDVERGEDWTKKEEPALRPYKNLFRGIHALFRHTVISLAEGNEKVPFFGSVEVFRGVRRGGVELVSRTYMGMAGSKPRDVDYVSRPNQIIENDVMLRNVADMAVPAAIAAPAAASEAAVAVGVGVFGTHKVVDSEPFEPKPEIEPFVVEKSAVEKAQERYIGDRARINEKPSGTGNLLKQAKRRQ